MLRCVIICPDRALSSELKRVLEDSVAHVARIIDGYPCAADLARILRAHAPEVVFLSVASMPKAIATIEALESCAPSIQVVAIHTTCDHDFLLHTMRVGVREFLTAPFHVASIAPALQRVADLVARKPVDYGSTDLVYSFVPSKPGVGTSTIAMNTAIAASRASGGGVLLSDFDLSSGMIRFMLKLKNEFSVADAVERALEIDENLWPQLVTSYQNVDVLHAGKVQPDFSIDEEQLKIIVNFARRNYKVVCFDLSGNLEQHAMELMYQSSRIFLVCTPEVHSVHLAREKYQYLHSTGVGPRVSVLLNRAQRKDVLTAAQVENALGVKVELSFPNDYAGIMQTLENGVPMGPDTEFGKQCNALAHVLLNQKQHAVRQKRRFLEFFSIASPRLGLQTDKGL